MPRSFRARWLLLAAALAASVAAAQLTGCGSGGESECKDGEGDAGDDGSGPQLPPPFTGDASAVSPFTSIILSPQDPTVTVDLNQKNPTIDFTATGVLPNGMKVPITNGSWNFNRI